MKKLYILLILIMAASVLTAAEKPAGEKISAGSKIMSGFKYKDITWSVPEVGREVQREVLDNSIIVYFMEDHRLPLVSIGAMLHCGEMYEPTERMAIPGLTGNVMRIGGTTHISADSLNLLLESLGINLQMSIGFDASNSGISCLTKDLETSVQIFADVLRNPAFPDDKLDLAKEQMRTMIKRRNDNVGGVVARELSHLIYGDNPYGRILEWSYIKGITRQDLAAYHSTYFVPNNLTLAVTGDFDKAKMKALLVKYLGDWAKKDVKLPDVPKIATAPKPGVYEIYKDLNQANIQFGHLGIDRNNPDRYAVNVMNWILGGGSFTSRMTSKVRSDEGLAYSVRSSFDPGSHDLGTFLASTETKNKTTHKAISLMLGEINRIRTEPVSDKELADAKDGFINRFVFNFTSADQIVGRLAALEFDKRPPDELKKYIDNIRAVTKDDVLRVAKQYLKPENLTFTVMGKLDDFEAPLDDLGKVIKIDLKPPVIE
jgi:zinc protease